MEGPVTTIRAADLEEDTRPMAHRYFGPDLGDRFVDSVDDQELKFTMRPDRWWSADFSKVQ